MIPSMKNPFKRQEEEPQRPVQYRPPSLPEKPVERKSLRGGGVMPPGQVMPGGEVIHGGPVEKEAKVRPTRFSESWDRWRSDNQASNPWADERAWKLARLAFEAGYDLRDQEDFPQPTRTIPH